MIPTPISTKKMRRRNAKKVPSIHEDFFQAPQQPRQPMMVTKAPVPSRM